MNEKIWKILDSWWGLCLDENHVQVEGAMHTRSRENYIFFLSSMLGHKNLEKSWTLWIKLDHARSTAKAVACAPKRKKNLYKLKKKKLDLMK